MAECSTLSYEEWGWQFPLKTSSAAPVSTSLYLLITPTPNIPHLMPLPFSFRHGRWFASGPGFVACLATVAECERFAQAKGSVAVFVR